MYYIKKKKVVSIDKIKPIKKPRKKVDLKAKLDKIFSMYIRLKYSNSNGICKCISCGKYHTWKEIQNGHYMSRRYMSTRFDEDNCRPQCVSCNIFNQGNIQMYRLGLIKDIGEKRVNLVELRAKSVTKKYSDIEYLSLIKYYLKEVEKMKEDKNI